MTATACMDAVPGPGSRIPDPGFQIPYEILRKQVKNGDILLVRGNKFVRVLTAGSYSHVAVLVWMPGDGGLWVYEFVEGKGFNPQPASQWFAQRQGQLLYYGIAPETVRSNPEAVYQAAVRYRHGKPVKRWYGWLSFPAIWVSKLINCRLPVWLKVCSTYAQEVWEAAGYKGFDTTADPETFVEHVQQLTRVEA